MVLVHSTSSHCHLSINQVSFQSLWYFPRYCSDRYPLWKIQSYSGYCVLHFHSLPSIYKPSFISIPFVLSMIWPGHTSFMTKTRLRGDNSINIQGRIMVLGFCPSSHCHLSICNTKFYINANSSFSKKSPDKVPGGRTENIKMSMTGWSNVYYTLRTIGSCIVCLCWIQCQATLLCNTLLKK